MILTNKRQNKRYALLISIVLFLIGVVIYCYSPKTEGVLMTFFSLSSHFLGSFFSVFFGGIESTHWFLFFLGHFVQYIIVFYLIFGVLNIYKRKI